MTKTAQATSRKRGSLILTEGRSGSNWLGSLSTGTGVLGTSGEWFARWAFPKELKSATMDEYLDATIERASTPNGYFTIKLFPAHLHLFNIKFGEDLITVLMDRYDCNFISLYRRDRLRQAISFARSIQTEQWSSRGGSKRDAQYNGNQIARCFFLINRSYAFWEDYAGIRQLEVTKFIYEDLLSAPQPYVDAIAKHANETVDTLPSSDFKIQRDDTTEEWIERFNKDIPNLNLVAASTPHRTYRRDPSNMGRFLRAKPMKPYPFTY